MLVNDLLYFSPLLDDFRPQLRCALLAQVFDLRSMRVTIMAELVEENVDLEILIQNFAFVFSDVFRAQLHLACANVVSILNESSVEHYTANHSFTCEPLVIEDNLGITSHSE